MYAASTRRTDLLLARHEGSYVRPEGAAWVVLVVAVFGAQFTANPLLTTASLLVIPLLISLLWRRGEAPVLLFVAAFQWLQITTKVFHANLRGLRVAEMGLTPTVETAAWLGLTALVVLALGIRAALWGAPPPRSLRAEAVQITPSRAFAFYALCLIVSVIAQGLRSVPGLSQPALALSEVRWLGFCVLGLVVLIRRKEIAYFAIAFAIEFVQGIGFFSGFKTAFFVTGIVILTVRPKLNARAITLSLVGAAALLVLGATWTAIKVDYRSYLNQGTGQQTVSVSWTDQIEMLSVMAGEVGAGEVLASIDPLLERTAYIDFFGVSIDHVPAVVDHQGGRIWGQAILNMMPRLIYPGKPVLPSDSEHTMKYTGLVMASGDQGTSISLGYVADSYVDFGALGMVAPIFLLGIIIGFVYKYFIIRSRSALIGSAAAVTVLISISAFEAPSVKIVAGLVVRFLVVAAAIKVGERWASRFLGFLDDRSASARVPHGAHMPHG